jgi:hypothetical protein
VVKKKKMFEKGKKQNIKRMRWRKNCTTIEKKRKTKDEKKNLK